MNLDTQEMVTVEEPTIPLYCQALNDLRKMPFHKLKWVGDQWRSPDELYWGINALFGPFVLDLFAEDDNALRFMKAQHDENRARAPGIFGDFVPPATDDDGYSAMTLWSLMSDLGQLCYCGGDVPFELKMVLED
ncbi:DNA N-6-adenine-methyltransferase [Klebsiella quasipneumoniae subsp. quasipneumoniae]|uniref:DNA N-6-adenine-methyltransferase n=1 Tax=Klebsiella pneumoniae complex TaxID=3390273 RepID=UPI0022F05227|nr:DNA N-6-adenine-methyltransferase [Klebsiella quasipneumoniae]MDA5091683.1 DNA N-6-adenine-methyltransferase [Klebsiella quasipneumoniae subsp. quasipneumoniae]